MAQDHDLHEFSPPTPAAQAWLGGIVNIAEDAIISVNGAQQIVLFNRGAEKMFGYAADAMIGQRLDVLLPDQFRAVHHAHMARFAGAPEPARTMGERRDIRGRRKNGQEFPAEASISKLRLGDEIVFNLHIF